MLECVPNLVADPKHLALLQQGVDVWNAWRIKEPSVRPDLIEADLSGAKLIGADLIEANLSNADLIGADLSRASLSMANLSGSHLGKAKLIEAGLGGADLRRANLSEADLIGAHLIDTHLGGADLSGADLTGCRIYGISAWDVKRSKKTKQQDLVITPPGEPEVTVDNVEVAQFVYLLLHNEKIRDVIDTVTSKVVLILGPSAGSSRRPPRSSSPDDSTR